jgi:hypothetical protein
MSARNRSPLGFASITLFHLCILALGVILQNLFEGESKGLATVVLVVLLVLAAPVGYLYRKFLWDVFRSFKSAGVLLSLLVLACILGTVIIQDLDLRRNGVFEPGTPDEETGVPPFDNRNQFTRFALAQSHGLLWLFPNAERKRLMEEKVKLSEFEEAQVELRATAFGSKAARSMRDQLLAAKRRQVEELTTSNYARRHQEGLYAFFNFTRRLHLFDIFESLWFYFLLALIAINNIVGTIARAPWNARDFGVVITHAGVLIVLAGALLDVMKAKEGYIQYVAGGPPESRTKSAIYDQKNKLETNLPFAVRLDRFATEYFHELRVERYDWSRRHDGSPWQSQEGTGQPFTARNRYAIRAGVPRVFEDGDLKVTIHDYKPRVFVRTSVGEQPGGRLNPAVEVGIFRQPSGGDNLLMTENAEPWLFAFDSHRSLRDYRLFRLEYVWAESPAEYEALLGKAPVPDNGTLILRRDGAEQRVPVRLGAAVDTSLGGAPVRIEFSRIASALADTKDVNVDASVQRSEEPVLYLRINGKAVFVPRDDRAFSKDFEILEGLELRFDWPDPRGYGVFNIYRIVGAEGRPHALVQSDAAGRPVTGALAPGKALPLQGRLQGTYLGIVKAVRSAVDTRAVDEVSDEEFLREGGDMRGKDRLLAAWADVEIEGPAGTLRRQLTPYDRPIVYPPDAERPLYAFGLEKTNKARDWFSVLSVLGRDGEPIKTHNVQVNAPLRHRGYRFFQATASQTREGFGISGISVTKNPGVNFMYVGYTVLTAGVCYLFFVRPIIDRRRRKQRRQEAAES